MVLLCFVLDLRSLSPTLLEDLKQSLLQLANFYAISSNSSRSLADSIGLCYVIFNRISSSDELKIAYSPQGNFSLRDFHHAVNSIPTDAFLPQLNRSGLLHCCDAKISSVLCNEVLYSWGEKDTVKKTIFLSSCFVEEVDSVMRDSLLDAADKCVTVEFILLEQKLSHLTGIQDTINNFVKHICDLENCSFRNCYPDALVLSGLVKQWLLELKEDTEEKLEAQLIFKTNLTGSLDRIICNLCRSANQLLDRLSPCKTCMCHGIPLDDKVGSKNKGCSSCPVTGQDLEAFDLIENSVKVGEHTVLFLPNCQSCMELQKVTSPLELNILERINLGSLSEGTGVIMGASYIVTPACQEMDSTIDSLNVQSFKGLCNALHFLDQGLVCSSYCNLETMRHTSFHCYYVLQPADEGPMLLRRLAGAEEFLPVPDINRIIDTSVTEEIENSIQASVLMMELRDYNPLQHEGGFHQKLNCLVKESLQFGCSRSIPSELEEATAEQRSSQLDSSDVPVQSKSAKNLSVAGGKIPQLDLVVKQDQTTVPVTEEWEQLFVTEVPRINSPSCTFKPKFEQSCQSSPDSSRQLDVKTSRILERLEVPRQLIMKQASPAVISNIVNDACMSTKKTFTRVLPTHAAEQGSIISQPMKPNFQRPKRKKI